MFSEKKQLVIVVDNNVLIPRCSLSSTVVCAN